MTGWLCRYTFLAGPPSFHPCVLTVFAAGGDRAAAVCALVTLKATGRELERVE